MHRGPVGEGVQFVRRKRQRQRIGTQPGDQESVGGHDRCGRFERAGGDEAAVVHRRAVVPLEQRGRFDLQLVTHAGEHSTQSAGVRVGAAGGVDEGRQHVCRRDLRSAVVSADRLANVTNGDLHPLTRPPPDRRRLLANGGHRRDQRGAPRRHRRGCRGDEGDHRRGRRKRQPSEVGDLEVPHEQPDAADECDQSHRHARQRELQAAAEHERHEIAVDGAEGHPRAQLHGALPDEVRHHAVDAERRHEQRRQAEERHDQRTQTLEQQVAEDDVVYRPHVFHHQRRIGLPDGAADGGDQLIGRQVRADDDVHRTDARRGDVELGRWRPVQAVVAHVANDADDLEAVVVGSARGAPRRRSDCARASTRARRLR